MILTITNLQGLKIKESKEIRSFETQKNACSVRTLRKLYTKIAKNKNTFSVLGTTQKTDNRKGNEIDASVPDTKVLSVQ